MENHNREGYTMHGKLSGLARLRSSLRKDPDKRLEWALENVPVLAPRGRDFAAAIIRRAHEDTNVFQAVIRCGGGAFGMFGGFFVSQSVGEPASRWDILAWSIIAGALGSAVAHIAAETIFRHRVRALSDSGPF